MAAIVLAANTILTAAGQIAALVICVFVLLFILVTVAFNLLTSFATSWLEEKVQLIKLLRPYVESINGSARSGERGVAPADNAQPVARVAGIVPQRLNDIDQKVEQVSDRVTNAAIEVRARTLQAKTIAKAFFLPGLMHREVTKEPVVDREGLEFTSPGYRALMEERPEVIPGREPRHEEPRQQVMPGQR
ncbi:hypothetical protein KDA_26320 [Dictyobacter alpinus]|uniref:Uncharacterized protein n=1 Tax=Dictyobacter alpinus TaxID=2014873 RepID=A0A402B715_9CHLR|nr:hypothetical protein [Dictyobacter alpinus]GCE27148.1 hypothetical protein KDA_26320 [Dictyobacter alpinus]